MAEEKRGKCADREKKGGFSKCFYLRQTTRQARRPSTHTASFPFAFALLAESASTGMNVFIASFLSTYEYHNALMGGKEGGGESTTCSAALRYISSSTHRTYPGPSRR